jgi:hypothetical protein
MNYLIIQKCTIGHSNLILSQGTAVTVLNTPSILIQIPALTTAVVIATLAYIGVVAIPATIIDVNGVE